jgi:uncharacterized transporter YbjL
MEYSQKLNVFGIAIIIVSVVLMFTVDMHNDMWRAIVIGLFAGSVAGWLTRKFWPHK